MRRRLAPTTLLLVLVSACKWFSKGTDGTGAASSTDATAPSAASAGNAADANSDDDPPRDPTAHGPETKPLTAEEKAARRTYLSGMVAGRKATLAKEYPSAIAAFDQALAAKKDDPHALSERGYAKLLSKDFAGARSDLTKALEGTDNPALEAQIYFNIGLVEENKGSADAARVAFARSNALRPSQAAKEKLEGKSKCVARIDKKPASKVVVVASLALAWDAMKTAFVKDGHTLDGLAKKPSTDEAIKASLCENECDRPVWFARFGQSASGFVGFAVSQLPDQKLALYELDDVPVSGCGGQLSGSVLPSKRVHVRTRIQTSTRVWMKMNAPKPTPCDDSNDNCVSACAMTDFRQTDWFIDTTKQVVIVSFEESGPMGSDGKPKPVLAIDESADRIEASGGGCTHEGVDVK
jgi:hypothetical protein